MNRMVEAMKIKILLVSNIRSGMELLKKGVTFFQKVAKLVRAPYGKVRSMFSARGAFTAEII